MRKYCIAAGIPARKAHPHALKHSIGMQVIKTAGIEHVRQYLGHKSGASTMQYLRVSDDDASKAVADDAFAGKQFAGFRLQPTRRIVGIDGVPTRPPNWENL